ncbi:MAG: DmsC/YnfH family molybdoenzyme membrane anchor subunit [Algisphaera sp.]
MPHLTLEGLDLIDGLLAEQGSLTAVDRFSQRHDRGDAPDQAIHYRDLIPLNQPAAGQQYAFEVDLDACSGCKACVVGCHSMNGLDEGETWRDVGQLALHEGERPLDDLIATAATHTAMATQHITTACHHCIDPGCLSGCPVKAYDKDPVTGIVKHLDDQCIGCQYCIFKCPYDVPKYSPSRGIVRKCDMCADRLAADEAPACVAACPTQAIKITVVNTRDAIDTAATGHFLPGSPAPQYTQPTTVYKGHRKLTRAAAANANIPTPEHAHLPLIVMLTLTQLAVGGLCALVLLDNTGTFENLPLARLVLAGVCTLAGLAGLISSTLHLGRPLYAFRAFLGLRTSWLSREIIGFGGWFNTVLMYVSLLVMKPDLLGGLARTALGGGVITTGLVAVFCSGMIYYDTPRRLWARWQTLASCFLTTATLGSGLALLLLIAWPGLLSQSTLTQLAMVMALATALQLLFEASAKSLAGTGDLLRGPLQPMAQARLGMGLIGGVLLPVVLLFVHTHSAQLLAALLAFSLTLAGEALARTLFFTAVVAPQMPGQPGRKPQ